MEYDIAAGGDGQGEAEFDTWRKVGICSFELKMEWK